MLLVFLLWAGLKAWRVAGAARSLLAVEDEARALAASGLANVDANAAEALLLGEPFLAEAAMEVGLVNRVVPPTEANAVAQAQARKLAAKPLSSLIETKRLMKKGQSAQVLAQIGEEAVSFGRMLREPAAREAFTAFMEKRRPDFSGV